MSRCTCNNPCTCFFEYDGDRPNTPYTLPYQRGRYSTRRSGTGTAAYPYVIEFLDSEEFQVEAGQIARSSNYNAPSGTTFNSIGALDTLVYETPSEIFLAFLIHIAENDGQMFPSAHKFWYVSAEATFVTNGATAAGQRTLLVFWQPPRAIYVPPIVSKMVVAGNVTSALPPGEDITLSCGGLVPVINSPEQINYFGPGGSFGLYLQQNSGANMIINNIKVTLVAI